MEWGGAVWSGAERMVDDVKSGAGRTDDGAEAKAERGKDGRSGRRVDGAERSGTEKWTNLACIYSCISFPLPFQITTFISITVVNLLLESVLGPAGG